MTSMTMVGNGEQRGWRSSPWGLGWWARATGTSCGHDKVNQCRQTYNGDEGIGVVLGSGGLGQLQ